jgi:hypothetical protein
MGWLKSLLHKGLGPISDEMFLKTLREYKRPASERQLAELRMAIDELDRRGCKRVPRADGGYDLVKGNPPGAESLRDPVGD